jgi:hypothetical protein
MKFSQDVMDEVSEIFEQHVIFQQALWVALEGKEIGLEVVERPDGRKVVKEVGFVEIVNRPDGGVLVRRGKRR